MERGGVLAAVLSAYIVSLAGALAVDGHVAARAEISPTLDPPSHEHFFKSDYPTDLSPDKKTHANFDPPFPAVQDSDEFDKDYVKDENSDDGEWKIQSDYDRLRGKLAQAKADRERALKVEAQKEKELAEAKAKEAAAKAKAKAAWEAKTAKEREADAKLQKEERDLAGVPPPPAGKGVQDATKQVDKQVVGLEDCQKELNAAREKLKALQEARKAAEAAEAEREAAADAAEAVQVQKMKYESEMEAQVAKQQAEWNDAHSEYMKESKQLAQMEEDFKKAEATLRMFRHGTDGTAGGVDSGGGVYRVAHVLNSSALKTTTAFALLLAIATVTLGGALV